MAYQYGIRNTYRPSKLAPNAYGWSQSAAYNRADVPTNLVSERPAGDQYLQQFAYEWFQSSQVPQQYGYTNPPFTSGAAGRLHPALVSASGGPARILRGYIRRAGIDVADETSKARLYFMYNPEIITRDYVNYLDQGALDPFNTVFQSGNLVAPPSIMDFTFSLLFDRQEEAMGSDNPGVFVDYQFFDMVVRNVVPTDVNQTNNTLPDNGVMMVNPRDITVVFSPQITVQGRPLNARVSFLKFTHRMVPTRMQIDLTIRAVYFGPVKDQVEYLAEQAIAQEQVSINEIPVADYNITYTDVQISTDILNNLLSNFPGATGFEGAFAALNSGQLTNTATQNDPVNVAGQLGQANDANHQLRLNALQWAIDHVVEGQTRYMGANTGSNRYNLPTSADCSGLVTSGYIGLGNNYAKQLDWQSHPGTGYILPHAQKTPTLFWVKKLSDMQESELLKGDVLIKDGHTGFLKDNTPGALKIFDASSSRSTPQVGTRSWPFRKNFTHVIRPTPVAATASVAASTAWNQTSHLVAAV